MDTKKILTAKEAREIAESSDFVKNRIYKSILEEAKECRTELTWDIQSPSDVTVKKIISTLEKDGYNVKYTKNEEDNFGVFNIKW